MPKKSFKQSRYEVNWTTKRLETSSSKLMPNKYSISKLPTKDTSPLLPTGNYYSQLQDMLQKNTINKDKNVLKSQTDLTVSCNVHKKMDTATNYKHGAPLTTPIPNKIYLSQNIVNDIVKTAIEHILNLTSPNYDYDTALNELSKHDQKELSIEEYEPQKLCHSNNNYVWKKEGITNKQEETTLHCHCSTKKSDKCTQTEPKKTRERKIKKKKKQVN